jgi:hypothetical protein
LIAAHHLTITIRHLIFTLGLERLLEFVVTFTRLHLKVDILLPCGKYLHDRIISLRGELWANKTSLNPPIFYWSVCTKSGMWAVMYLCVRGIVTKPVPSQETERSCICVLDVSSLPLSTILILDFGIVP